MNRTLAITAACVAGLVGAGIASEGASRDGAEDAGARETAARVEPIARRVEEIRKLRFESYPKPQVVSPEQTRKAALDEVDREYPRERQRSDSDLLALLGLVEPGTDLRDVQADISGGQVAGFYDTRRRRLAIVAGEGTSDALLSEITLAHELTHALEDQRFDLRELSGAGADDEASAYSALVEGSATVVMGDYVQRFVSPSKALVSALGAIGPAAQAADEIPPYIQASLEFPYTWGERFVRRLYEEGGDSWRLVDRAFRSRPPTSTEQIIHPEKYLAGDKPASVRLRAGWVLGDDWTRRAGGSIGEFDTYALLELGVAPGVAGDAAAGWGGGRYELWALPGECDSPCRSRNALVLGWRWDSALDARQFRRALPGYVTGGLDGDPAGTGAWRVGDGSAAMTARGRSTTLALAPDAATARRLASEALVD